MQIIDNFLEESQHLEILDYCLSTSYILGEKDRDDTESVGLVAPFDIDILADQIHRRLFLSKTNIERSYINLFNPGDDPYYHTDGNVWTLLYYPNKIDTINNIEHIDEKGETHFLQNGKLTGVPYVANRLIKFDGNVLHRANSFRTHVRHTVAIKYRR